MNGTAAISRLTDGRYAFVVENNKHAPEINVGDLVLVDLECGGFTEAGFYMMGSGRLTRCEACGAPGMIRICEDHADPGREFDTEVFAEAIDGRVEQFMPWLEDATPEFIDSLVWKLGIPMINPSKQPIELDQIIASASKFRSAVMAGAAS